MHLVPNSSQNQENIFGARFAGRLKRKLFPY